MSASTPADRLVQALADRYRIERELGAGGMATVYLAHDLKHDRQVALKVLRPDLAAVIGAERFLSEIRTTANLQHAHILPLFDSGTVRIDGRSPVAEGQRAGETNDQQPTTSLFYVMPFVEGESLRDRITREQQLPVDDAVRITREVASALDYAHRRGVIHRDIKPENILLHEGQALVADFGIALAASRAGGTRMTETGMSLGTPHYMSPEQAMGEREITPRSDVYALGCVLYEMLTGEPPFTGPTAQAIVARVLTETPRPMIPQRHTIPASLEAAVFQALEKLPADRFGSAAEFSAALGDQKFAGRTAAGQRGMRSAGSAGGRRVVVAGWALALVLAAATAWGWLRSAPPPPVTRYSMAFPPDQAMQQGLTGVNIAISSDGRRIVYVGAGKGGNQLWVRERDRLDATPLAGTERASNPFFSPDGSQVAFSVGATTELKVIAVSGGPAITLATPGVGTQGGGAWGPDGWIYFDSQGGLSRIKASGGTPELIVPYDTARHEIGYAWPDALPNGRGLIFRSRRGSDPTDFDLEAFDLRTHERHILTRGLLARYVAPGYLVYLRADGAVLAAPFDDRKLVLTGPTTSLFDGVMTKPLGSGDLAISRSGTLLYVAGHNDAAGVAELVYVDRDSSVHPLTPPFTFTPSSLNQALALSPDGTRLALVVAGSPATDIWIKQLPSGPLSRLTFSKTFAGRPQWTPDGRYVTYITLEDPGTRQSFWRRRADGSSPPELVLRVPGQNVLGGTYSKDGRWLVYTLTSDSAPVGAPGEKATDILARRTTGDTTPVLLLSGSAHKEGAALSPDGRWLAYFSDESGRNQVYVVPFPSTTSGRWQVSTGGGLVPRWSPNGRELFFDDGTGLLFSVPVGTGPTFAPGTPVAIPPAALLSRATPFYDITPDGRRFVRVRLAVGNQPPGGGQVVVVDNWFGELKARMGGR